MSYWRNFCIGRYSRPINYFLDCYDAKTKPSGTVVNLNKTLGGEVGQKRITECLGCGKMSL